MTSSDFLTFTASEFQVPIEKISLEMEFRNIPTWSSLNALIFIASIHEKSGVLISSESLSGFKYLEDILHLIESSK